MAHLSDGLFTTAIAVYAGAMVGFTAEFAFARVGRKADARAAAPGKVLVGAGGPAVPTAPAAGAVTPPAPRRGGAARIGRWAVVLLVLGALIHASSIAVRASAVDAVPWSNMYEFASVAGLVGVIAFLAVLWKLPALRHLGGFVLLPVILVMFLAGTVLYSDAQPLVPALQSYWLAIHVTLVSIGDGALMTSAVLSVLYLMKIRYDRRSVEAGYEPGSLGTLAAKLPSAATLDKAAYRVVAFSFPLY